MKAKPIILIIVLVVVAVVAYNYAKKANLFGSGEKSPKRAWMSSVPPAITTGRLPKGPDPLTCNVPSRTSQVTLVVPLAPSGGASSAQVPGPALTIVRAG